MSDAQDHEAVDLPRCVCCDGVAMPRTKDDPWEGRLDGYCTECALSRCDAYPGQCAQRSAPIIGRLRNEIERLTAQLSSVTEQRDRYERVVRAIHAQRAADREREVDLKFASWGDAGDAALLLACLQRREAADVEFYAALAAVQVSEEPGPPSEPFAHVCALPDGHTGQCRCSCGYLFPAALSDLPMDDT